MWWRLPLKEWKAGKGQGNLKAVRRLVKAADLPPGLLAYVEDEPAGWIALAPRAEYPRLAGSRVLKPVDDQPVWSVTCFFIARAHRGRGLGLALLEAAVEFARDQRAEWLEGYPVEPRSRQADAFVYTGLRSTFAKAGFEEVARRSPTRPIMRRKL
ncbi:MAG TPA: GNAT family N-acetyltransferase [Verrucomicrobiales bacterium]|nr:GNAT family N-acetyltransferase [Verrucomicrobiales bacterium]